MAHNELEGLQGGSIDERYHLSENEYVKLTSEGSEETEDASELHIHDERYYTKDEVDAIIIPLSSPLPVDVRDVVNMPDSFEGNGGKVLILREDETAIEYALLGDLVQDLININNILGVQDLSEIPLHLLAVSADGTEVLGRDPKEVIAENLAVSDEETISGEVSAAGELILEVKLSDDFQVTSPDGIKLSDEIKEKLDALPYELQDIFPIEPEDAHKIVRVKSPADDGEYELVALTADIVEETDTRKFLSLDNFAELIPLVDGEGVELSHDAEGLKATIKAGEEFEFDEEGNLTLSVSALADKVSGSVIVSEGKLQLHNDVTSPLSNFAYGARGSEKGFVEFQQPIKVYKDGVLIGSNVIAMNFVGLDVTIVEGVAIITTAA